MMDYAGIPVQDAAKPQLRLNERLIAKWFPIGPGYFRTLQIPLKCGREFTEHDTGEAQRVAAIEEHLAHRLWPAYPAGLNPVGQHLFVGGTNPKSAEIVGVVGNVRQNLDDSADWQESVYVSFSQSPQSAAMLALRTIGDQLALTRAIRQQVRNLDREQPVGAVQTMEDRVEAQVGQTPFAGSTVRLVRLGSAGARSRRHLRGHRLLGSSAHSGNGHSASLRCAAQRHPSPRDGSRIDPCVHRDYRWRDCGSGLDACDDSSALPYQRYRSLDLCWDRSALFSRRTRRQLHSGAACHPDRSNGRSAGLME
jgi:hypothetical protein